MRDVLRSPELRALYRRARCVFFDCDGVIFDSNGFKIAAMHRALAKAGFAVTARVRLPHKVALLHVRERATAA